MTYRTMFMRFFKGGYLEKSDVEVKEMGRVDGTGDLMLTSRPMSVTVKAYHCTEDGCQQGQEKTTGRTRKRRRSTNSNG